ncbi:MAG: hypothetical protein FWF77_00050 [Defluviitaleaceae bacterium]|nr:hypothetical protein [Defluviitaleaceae bacterium]
MKNPDRTQAELVETLQSAMNEGGDEELAIRSEDYEKAKGERAKLTVRIRILRTSHVKINSLHWVKISDTLYTIWKINGTINRHGVPVHDITLAASTEVSA